MSNVIVIKRASYLLYRELMNLVKECEEYQSSNKGTELQELDHYTVISNYEEFLEAAEMLREAQPDFVFLKEYMNMTVDLLEIIREAKWNDEGSEETYNLILEYFKKRVGGEVTVFLNVYRLDRRYGGPEEGGWYYDHLSCVHTKEVSFSEIQKEKDALTKEYGTGEGNISSVLGGYEIHIYAEDEPSKSETKERPYYC